MKNVISRTKQLIIFFILLIVVVSLFAYAMFQGGYVSWFLFYSVVVSVIFTLGVTFFPFRVLDVTRRLNKTNTRPGEPIEVTVVIKKRPFQPFFYVRVKDLPPISVAGNKTEGALFFFTLERELAFSYTIQLERGVHEFKKVELLFVDLFGLFERKMEVNCDTTVVVYPNFEQLAKLPIADTIIEPDGQRVRDSVSQYGQSISGVRKYVPGDRLVSIHWKQSARLTQLMTKELESTEGERILVAFDPYSREKSERFEQTIELCASLLATLLVRRTAVNFTVRSEVWHTIEVTSATFLKGLMLLAPLEVNHVPLRPEQSDFSDWKGMQVLYVCVDLDEKMVDLVRSMKNQKVNVCICTWAPPNQQRHFIKELEKLGVSMYIKEED